MDLTLSLLTGLWSGFASLPGWVVVIVAALVPAIGCLMVMTMGPLVYVYAERKVSAFMQDRLGPMRVGHWGLLQTVADTIKLVFKEAIYPRGIEKSLFILGPCLVVTGAFMPLFVIPFGTRAQGADLDIGLFYVVAVASISTVGIIMSGWASNNKYAMFGAMRSAAQIVSYEIPSLVTLLVPILIVGSLRLQDVVLAQQQGGLSTWLIFRYFPVMPVVFLVFFTSILAETNRAPFDIPEAESELVAGFHTEYSGFFFAMFFMAEYTEMLVLSAVASVVFFGGPLAPVHSLQSLWFVGLPDVGLGPVWLIAKAWTLIFVMMWLRWTLPRLRVDQLMHIAWKVLLPTALVLVVLMSGLLLWPATENGFPWDRFVGWPLTAALALWLTVRAIAGARFAVSRNRELA